MKVSKYQKFAVSLMAMRKQIKPILRPTTPANSLVWGWFFVVFGTVFFGGFVYASIVSKFLPPAKNPLLSAIQQDRYYCFLVPLSLPILVVAVYFHWLCMKLFKHA